MIVYEQILPHVPAFAAVLARISGLFLFTPVLTSSSIPMQIKVATALAFTFAVYPLANLEHLVGMEIDLIQLLPLVLTELAIGAVLGIFAGIPLLSVQLAGLLAGQQMGLGLAQTFNPAMDIEGDNLGQLYFIIATAAFVAIGGLETLAGCLIHSFSLIPAASPGAALIDVNILTGLIHSGFDMAFRIAMPVLTIVFLETIATGFLMKTVPTINVMTFGFPLRVMLGIFASIAGLIAANELIVKEVDMGLQVAQDWLWTFAPPPGMDTASQDPAAAFDQFNDRFNPVDSAPSTSADTSGGGVRGR